MRKKVRLSKSEMAGFLVLLVVIVSIVALIQYKDNIFPKKSNIAAITPQEIKEIEDFSKQIQTDSIKQKKQLTKGKITRKQLKLFSFDPNTADSASLIKLGLQHWQVSNLLKYRRKGGRWRNVDDFAKLYGLSEEEFQTLRPYIFIAKTEKEIRQERRKQRNDSIFHTYPKKYLAGTTLSLNDADTTSLKGIPGIGSYYAGKICRYRERLGGFLSIEQLKEIDGLPEDIEKWFTIEANPTVKQIKINETDFKGLMRHPYLDFEKVKAICNYIRKYGKLKSWEELSNNENFTSKDFKRLEPYFSFE